MLGCNKLGAVLLAFLLCSMLGRVLRRALGSCVFICFGCGQDSFLHGAAFPRWSLCWCCPNHAPVATGRPAGRLVQWKYVALHLGLPLVSDNMGLRWNEFNLSIALACLHVCCCIARHP